jgi:hypothetical protein
MINSIIYYFYILKFHKSITVDSHALKQSGFQIFSTIKCLIGNQS